MAIAPGLIWRAIFVFIGIRFYLFLRKIFLGVAKIFRNRNFFVAQLHRIARDHDTRGGARRSLQPVEGSQ
ncbi:MAG: hypothetical protein DME52_10265 [Verrucomicrobia bacterium]|nr:MAG: hypothetical protein DME52_10265 [Verrucomicrobiota bacterium]